MQQYQLLITDGHAWAARIRRVRPYALGLAVCAAIAAFFLFTSLIHEIRGTRPETLSTRRHYVEIAAITEALKKADIPRNSPNVSGFSTDPIDVTIRAVTEDLNDDGELNTVAVQLVGAEELFQRDGAFRGTKLSADLYALTRGTINHQIFKTNTTGERWIGFARKFGDKWKVATWKGPSGGGLQLFNPMVSLKALNDAIK